MTDRRRVLFVDDEPHVLAALVRVLRSEGDLEITTAGSVTEALDLMARGAFDVVVTDQIMPGRTGSDLLHEVAALYPATVRIILSGSMRGTHATSAHFVLDKPSTREALLVAVRHAAPGPGPA